MGCHPILYTLPSTPTFPGRPWPDVQADLQRYSILSFSLPRPRSIDSFGIRDRETTDKNEPLSRYVLKRHVEQDCYFSIPRY